MNIRRILKIFAILLLTLFIALVVIIRTTLWDSLEEVNRRQALLQMQTIFEKIEYYRAQCGFYPKKIGDLVLPEDECLRLKGRSVIKKIPKDPWKNQYSLVSNGEEFVLKTIGKNRYLVLKTNDNNYEIFDLSNLDSKIRIPITK